jgi:hypothetical protein
MICASTAALAISIVRGVIKQGGVIVSYESEAAKKILAINR